MYTTMYPLDMAKTVAVREFRSSLSSLLDYVRDQQDRVVVTRNGAPVATLISIADYESIEETMEILSDPGTMAAIEEGLSELGRGEVVPFDEVRRELAERRAEAT